jgi:hypothetical protein
MSYQIVSISNEKGAPDQAYNKLEKAAASSGANFAGKLFQAEWTVLSISSYTMCRSLHLFTNFVVI